MGRETTYNYLVSGSVIWLIIGIIFLIANPKYLSSWSYILAWFFLFGLPSYMAWIIGKLSKKRKELESRAEASLERAPQRLESREEILDPYLESIKEKFYEAEYYFKGEKGVLWGPVIILFFDAIMSALQRLVIDTKGIKPIEQMRKDRKLYFDNLISVLRESRIIDPEDLKNLEMLRDLRNRVVHEDYHPTKRHASWAFKIAKSFISKKYPKVFEKSDAV